MIFCPSKIQRVAKARWFTEIERYLYNMLIQNKNVPWNTIINNPIICEGQVHVPLPSSQNLTESTSKHHYDIQSNGLPNQFRRSTELIWSIGTGSKNIHGQNLFDGRVLQNNYLHFHLNDMSNLFVYYSHPIPAFHTLLPKTFKRTICWKLTFQIIFWKLWMIRFIWMHF